MPTLLFSLLLSISWFLRCLLVDCFLQVIAPVAVTAAPSVVDTAGPNVSKTQFESLLATGQFDAAINLAVNAPQGVLRTPETIQRFFQTAVPQGQRALVLQYFQTLLSKGKLNKIESVELVRPLIAAGSEQARKKIEEWVRDDKLDYSEDLGDLLRNTDLRLACSVFCRAQIPTKTIGCFLQLGEYAKIIAYAKNVRFTPDYPVLLQQLHRYKPEEARAFAAMLLHNEDGMCGVTLSHILLFLLGPEVFLMLCVHSL